MLTTCKEKEKEILKKKKKKKKFPNVRKVKITKKRKNEIKIFTSLKKKRKNSFITMAINSQDSNGIAPHFHQARNPEAAVNNDELGRILIKRPIKNFQRSLLTFFF